MMNLTLEARGEHSVPSITVLDDLERERILLEVEQNMLFRTHEMVVDRLVEIDEILEALDRLDAEMDGSPKPGGEQ